MVFYTDWVVLVKTNNSPGKVEKEYCEKNDRHSRKRLDVRKSQAIQEEQDYVDYESPDVPHRKSLNRIMVTNPTCYDQRVREYHVPQRSNVLQRTSYPRRNPGGCGES